MGRKDEGGINQPEWDVIIAPDGGFLAGPLDHHLSLSALMLWPASLLLKLSKALSSQDHYFTQNMPRESAVIVNLKIS